MTRISDKNPRTDEPGDGLCRCGCGAVTPVATYTRASSGHVKGRHVPFVRGHERVMVALDDYDRVPRGDDGDECWVWRGSTTRDGHGIVRDWSGANTTIQRLSYRHHNLGGSDLPDYTRVISVCGSRLCMNPSHLIVVDHAAACKNRHPKKGNPPR